MKALTTLLPTIDAQLLGLSAPLHWSAPWGFLGAWLYLAGFALPLPWELPLVGFALCSTLAITAGASARIPGWTPLTLAVMAFLGATAVSTVGSVALGRSLILSTPLLPAGLLFLVIMAHCAGPRDIRRLYLTLSAVGLGLAATLLWVAWHGKGANVNALIASSGIPILVVPNDLTFLAVIAPFSFVLLCRKPLGMIGIFAAASIGLSLCTICIFRSRTAALTMVFCLLCAAVLVQPRHWLIRSLAGIGMLLVFSLVFNALFFPDSQLVLKVIRFQGSAKWSILERVAYWSKAWTMFLEAPLLGKGPHTFGLVYRTPWPFNLYLEVLAGQGLFGLTALGSMLACGIVGGWKLRRASTADGRLLGAGALAGLIGLCSAGMVELTLLREWVVTMLFTLLGVIDHLVSTQLPLKETLE